MRVVRQAPSSEPQTCMGRLYLLCSRMLGTQVACSAEVSSAAMLHLAAYVRLTGVKEFTLSLWTPGCCRCSPSLLGFCWFW